MRNNEDIKPDGIKSIWRVWLRLHKGGIMGLPFPADNAGTAQKLAERAENVFGGEMVHLEKIKPLESDF